MSERVEPPLGDSQPEESHPARKPFQFGLRELFLAMTVGAMIAWIATDSVASIVVAAICSIASVATSTREKWRELINYSWRGPEDQDDAKPE